MLCICIFSFKQNMRWKWNTDYYKILIYQCISHSISEHWRRAPVALSPAQCCPCSAQLISHVGPNLGLLVVSSLSDANLKFHPSVPPHQMAAHLYQDTISAPHWAFISPASWMLYCCLISNDGVNLHIIGCAGVVVVWLQTPVGIIGRRC